MTNKNGTVSCNMCGNELGFFDLQQRFHVHNKLGYGSNYDGEVIELDLCSTCLDRLIDACKINPIDSDDE